MKVEGVGASEVRAVGLHPMVVRARAGAVAAVLLLDKQPDGRP